MTPGKPPQRILIVRPSALGDVARTVPVLVSLKRAFPDSRIDWLVNDQFADAIAHHPDLDEIVPFPRHRFRRFGISPKITLEVFGYMRRLRSRGYDRVYDLQGLGRSGYITRATRAPRRVGPADARELGWLGYTHRHPIDPSVTHTVDRMLGVLAADGVAPVRDLRLYTPPADQQWASKWLDEHGAADCRLAVVAPGAKWASKRWPAPRFAQCAVDLRAMGFERVVIIGSDDEREHCRPVLEATNAGKPVCLDLVGQTTVGQLMAIIERCDLLVANDSAPLHLGVGLGRHCVGLFGATDPSRVGPYRYPIGTVCAAGAQDVNYRSAREDQTLIGSIESQEVLMAVRRVLENDPPVVFWDPDAEPPEAQ